MPTLEVKNWNNEKVGSVELPEEIFDAPFREHLVHEAVRNHLASRRAGTHKTKVRHEVRGSGRKPYRQKGTGRARQGGSRPPIHRGGGVAHGPQPRDHSYKMNVKEKRGALKAVLSSKVRDGQFVLLESLGIDEPRTKTLVENCGQLGLSDKMLFVDSLENLNLLLASRNHPKMQVVDANGVNVYDVLNSRFVVISREALDRLMEALSK
ncbi:MAG: 50S ribosomal protein L4 [Thermoanaerobaculia bacterium]|nr:50S ribosomal protein L4 [Thermoanaerobaculia bacterium]